MHDMKIFFLEYFFKLVWVSLIEAVTKICFEIFIEPEMNHDWFYENKEVDTTILYTQ